MVSNENIEIVNNYTYLGVKFSANGNFTNHKKQRDPFLPLDVMHILFHCDLFKQ